MKKFLFIILIIISLIFSLINCKREKISDNEGTVENVTQFVKDYGIYVYTNEEDLGKDAKEVKEKEWFEFGTKFTVLKTKKVEEKDYYHIQLPDKSKYWAPKESFTEKFIVIIQNDVDVYSQPDQDFKTGIELQPGDFGIFIKEQDGWYNVDFKALRPSKQGDEERKWVGQGWIKEGYTDDIMAAKEAYYLYLAYYNEIINKNTQRAINYLHKALEINKGDRSDIYPIIEKYLEQLEAELD